MAFTINPITGNITFGVVSDGTHDAVARDLASEFGVSEDFKDTFNADNWIDAGTAINVNTGSEVIDWNVNDTSINHATAFDLGIISNTTWVLRAKLVVNNVTAGADANTNRLYFGIFDSDQSVDSNTLQDGLFLGFIRGSIANQIGLYHRDGVVLDGSADVAFTTPITATTFYIEIKRTSTMDVTMSLFSDAKYTTLIETQSAVIPTTIQSLRFIKAQNRSTLTGDSILDGTIDDVQFWNTTTAPRITSLDWSIRFKLNLTNLDDGANNIDKRLYMGLFDEDETSGANNAQDGFFLLANIDNVLFTYAVRTPDNQAPRVAPNDIVMSTSPSVSTFFVELRRTSGSNGSVTLFTDNTFTTILETNPLTTISGTSNLRYLKLMNDEISDDTGEASQGAIDGTFDDLVYTDFEQLIVMPTKTFIVDAVLEGCTADFCENFNEYALSKLPSFREKFNFSTQALADASWVSSDTALIRVDPVNEELDFDWTNHSVSDRIFHDLGSTVSQTDWTFRCKVTFSSVGVVTINAFCIGLYDSNAQDSGVAQDGVTIFMSNVVALRVYDNESLILGSISPSQTQPTVGVPVFWELKRIGGDTFRFTQYSDSNYSVIIDSEEVTNVPTTVDGLRFIKCLQRNDFTAGQITGTFEDIEFWNDGQQGDKTFQDSFLQKPVTFGDDFSSYLDQGSANTAWVPQDVSFMEVNITNDNLEWNSTIDGTNNSIAHDLGVAGVNDTNWTLRFRYTTASLSVGSSTGKYAWFGLFDSDGTVDSETTQDAIAFYITVALGGNSINLAQRDGVILSNAGTNATLTTINTASDLFFVELKRVSATLAELTLYSDSTYTTVIESTTLTIPSTLTGLRYIAIKNRTLPAETGSMNGTIDDVEFYNGTSTLADWSGVTGNDIGLDIINKRINFDIPQGVQRDELLTHDLQSSIGVNASDDNWTLRFKINTDSITQGASEESASLFVGLDDGLLGSRTGTHDFIALGIIIDQGGAGPQFGAIPTLRTTDAGDYFTGATGSNFPFMWTTGTLYCEVKRVSKTLAEATIYSDATFRNVFSPTVQVTIPPTLDNLRYIRITTDSSAVANDNPWDGSVDDIEFYNGVSVPRTPISELPKLFEDRVDTDKGWVTSDATAMAVNLSTQVLDINVLRDGTQDAIAFDLGAGVVSDTRWGLRFKYDITAIDPANTGTKRIVCGLFDTNQVASIASPQDSIHVLVQLATDTTLIRANATDGTNPQSGGFFKEFINVITQVQTYYFEIIRISATSYSVEIFSDPDYQISLEKQTIDNIPVTLSGLRYIKFLGDETSGPVTGSFTGTIDDIQLWNGQVPLDHRNKWRVLDL